MCVAQKQAELSHCICLRAYTGWATLCVTCIAHMLFLIIQIIMCLPLEVRFLQSSVTPSMRSCFGIQHASNNVCSYALDYRPDSFTWLFVTDLV